MLESKLLADSYSIMPLILYGFNPKKKVRIIRVDVAVHVHVRENRSN